MATPRGVEYEQLIVFVNPNSRRADRMRLFLEHLKDNHFGNRLDWFDTLSSTHEDTMALLAKRVRGGDVIGVGGGDGTLNMIAKALCDQSMVDYVRRAPVLPMWGGNANDGANSLNPFRLRKQPDKILRQGRLAKIHPLDVTFKGPEFQAQRLAVLYASLGITALTAQKINERRTEAQADGWLRNWYGDTHAFREALKEAEGFDTFNGEPSGHYYEIMFNNAPCMAKLLRPVVSLEQPEYRITTATDKRARTLTPVIGDLLLGVEAGEPVINRITSFTTLHPTRAETDGEAFGLPAFTDVQVGVHNWPFNAVTTFGSDY
jgi:hypothetical protein